MQSESTYLPLLEKSKIVKLVIYALQEEGIKYLALKTLSDLNGSYLSVKDQACCILVNDSFKLKSLDEKVHKRSLTFWATGNVDPNALAAAIGRWLGKILSKESARTKLSTESGEKKKEKGGKEKEKKGEDKK